MRPSDPSFGLVGDIGGTNCRFALAQRGKTALVSPASYPCAGFDDVLGAIDHYLRTEAGTLKVQWANIAVAGPVDADAVAMTNRAWRISGPEIARKFAMKDVRLVNDFSAYAAASQYMDASHLIAVGAGAPRASNNVLTTAVIGPGTGLGVSGLMRGATEALVMTTEGGHATFAPVDDLEREIERVLRPRFDRISYERLLSGEGLSNLSWALAAIDGVKEEVIDPREITKRAAAHSDPRSAMAVTVFARVLGSFAGDVVLTLGARGGLYIAGGMLPAILDIFDRAAFRARFEAKGRFGPYMAEIPTWILIHPFAPLIGAALLAEQDAVQHVTLERSDVAAG